MFEPLPFQPIAHSLDLRVKFTQCVTKSFLRHMTVLLAKFRGPRHRFKNCRLVEHDLIQHIDYDVLILGGKGGKSFGFS